MLKSYKFWFKAGSWMLVITALLHSLSLLQEPIGENEAERQLLNLMDSHRLVGIDRTMEELMFFFSLSLTLFTIFVAVLNFLFARYYMPSPHARTWVIANVVFWTIFLLPLFLFTFIIPIICYTICWLFFATAFILYKKESSPLFATP